MFLALDRCSLCLLAFDLLNLSNGSRLDEFCDLDAAVRIKNGSKTFLLVIVLIALRCEHARNLSKDSDGVYRVNVRDDVAVRVLVLEQKRAKVGLPATHHFLDCCHDRGVPNDDCLVKTGEEWTTGDR